MDRSDDTSFCERFQESCPEKVAQLRRAILGDVKETNGQIIHARTYHKFLVALPPLDTFPLEFGNLFKDKYIDLDMQDDLERTEVINWCRTTKKVYALRTTADGNCLLHAVSQGLWGIEDKELFLRRLLYVNLVTDPKGVFQKRWMYHQRNSTDLHRFDVRLNTAECTEEWESVIKATEDHARSQSHGLPYTALESIHLYVTANILRRPIIVLADSMARTVYGETIQDSQISGIYFPLEWPPEQCEKNPLVIGYNMNHFAPLVFEEDARTSQSDVTIRAIPLASKEMDSIPARYLLPEEEADFANILRDYLHTTEVFYGATSLPAAKVALVQLPDTVNIVDACRKDCERKFRRLVDQDNETAVQPFNFQTTNRERPVQNIVAPPAPINVQNNPHRKRCGTIGCEHFANPETQNLCSKCFNDFTIQYHRQEEAVKRASKRPKLQFGQTQAMARQQPTRANFHDLSMMGEDCHAGCGFKCSTETYPYCHECYPKYVGSGQQVTQTEPTREPMQLELSMMPETCRNCTYRCSKATYPYCHDCFPKFVNPTQADPTAPPPSVSVQEGTAMIIQSTDETTVVSSNKPLQPSKGQPLNTPQQIEPMDVQIGSGVLDRKCKTLQCNNVAIKGNNGYCDTCYQLNLFGGGASPGNTPNSGPAVAKCITAGCQNLSVSETAECLSCFQKGDRNQPHSPTEALPQNTGMNIVPTQEDKILNSGPSRLIKPPDQTATFSLSGASMRSTPAEHDETAGQVAVNAPLPEDTYAERQRQYQSGESRKYICATPGCDGIRTENEHGLCFSCLRNYSGTEIGLARPPSGNNLENSVPYVSCSPVALTEEEKKKLYPIVVSSKDKVKCASPTCQMLIYPPKKLCDTCKAVLEKHQASRSKEENRKSVGGIGAACLTEGCTFFGSPGFKGYCSSCYKAQAPRTRYTAPLMQRPTITSNPAQIQTEGQQQESRHTAPILPAKAKLCIEKGCTRYGDPSQRDRCSFHFQQASAQFLPMSPASIEQNRQIIAQQQSQQQKSRQKPTGNRHNVVPGTNAHIPTRNETVRTHDHGGTSQIVIGSSSISQQPMNRSPDVNSFEATYGRLISSKKSTNLCKNNSVTGCVNYGNSSKGGYCNTCYPEIQRMNQTRT